MRLFKVETGGATYHLALAEGTIEEALAVIKRSDGYDPIADGDEMPSLTEVFEARAREIRVRDEDGEHRKSLWDYFVATVEPEAICCSEWS